MNDNPNPDINKDAKVTPDPVDPTGDPANPDNGTGGQGGDDPKIVDPNAGGDVDYKSKFGESTKENQRVMDILKKNNIDPATGEAIQTDPVDPADNPEFSDEKLEKAITGFSNLSESEKDIIRNAKTTAKSMTELKKTVAQILDKDKFNTDLAGIKKDSVIGKVISENEDEFKTFAYKPENLKTDTVTLAKAFALDKGAVAKQEEGVRLGREGNTGGGKTLGTTKDGKTLMTSAEAGVLRKNDPRQYNDLVSKKKLVITDE